MASDLTGRLNVDNAFQAYISTDDAVQGTLIGSGNNWPTTVNIATTLTAGQDYYLHIYATDAGGVAGFLGDFTLTGTDHAFSNGLTSLNTNTADWSVSKLGWGGYVAADGYGINGVSPWGARSGVDANAVWIWSADSNGDNVNYFSTAITATPPPAALPVVTDAAGSCMADSLIVVEFASAVDPIDMVDPSNYSIDNGATITAISVQDDTRAILTIDSLDPALNYILTVGTQDTSVRFSGALGSYYDQRTGAGGSKVQWGGNDANLFGGTRYYSQDSQINFNWGTGMPGAFPSGSGNNEDFSVRWDTYVVPTQTGVYRFRTNSDDGIRVSIDGSMVVNDWGLHGPRIRPTAGNEVSISLNANTPYSLLLEFFERGGGAVAQLQWSVDGGPWVAVPNNNYSSCHATPPALPTPVLEYRFDEDSWDGTADEVVDSSSTGLNGKAVGNTNTITEGQICRAGTFDGAGDIDVSGINSYLNTTASLSFWVKSSQLGGGSAWTSPGITGVEQSGGGNDIFWGYLDSSGHIRIQKGNGSSARSNNPLNDTNWQHVVLTYDSPSGAVQVFIDGNLENSVISESGDVSTVFSSIGRIEGNSGLNFTGQLDELMVFNSVISASDVSAIHTNQLAGNNYDGSARTCPIPPPTTCDVGTLNAVGVKIDNVGSNSQINNTTEALAIHAAWLAAGSPSSGLINGGTYNVAASGLSTVDRIDFGGSEHDFSGTLPYPGVSAGVTGSDFLVHASGTLSLPAGDYTIFTESDDGFSFVMNTRSGDNVTFSKFGSSNSGASNELRFENPTGNSNTGGSFTLTQDSVFDIAGIFFERGGGDFFEISIANDIRSNAAPTGYEILRDGALSGKVAFGYCDPPSGCGVSFPDGISSHNGGAVDFGFNAQLFLSPDGILDAGSVIKNGGSSVLTCDYVDCSVSGSATPILNPGAFPIFTSNKNISVNSNQTKTLGQQGGTDTYDSVSVAGTLNVSNNYTEYYIKNMNLQWGGVVNFNAGDYWIENLSVSSSTTINVVGGGTARIFVKNAVTFGSSSLINSPSIGAAGTAEQLLIYGYSTVGLSSNTTLSGVIYSQSNVTLGSPSYVFGAITASNTTLSSTAQVSYDASAISSIDFGDLCNGTSCSFGSFEITQPSYGLACPNARADINIKAMCADGTTVKTDYAGTIDLSSDENTQSDFFLSNSGGSVVNNVVLTGSENGEVDVYLFHKNENPDLKVTAEDAVIGTIGEASTGTDFRTSGFAVTAPTNFVCGGNTSMTLTAIGEDAAGTSCSQLTGFSGNKALKAWSDINIDTTEAPGIKDSGLPVSVLVDGQPLAETEPASTNITLNFVSGVSTFPISYLDVGEVLNINVLHDDAPYDGSEPPLSSLAASSGLFIVSPDHVEVKADDSLAACTAPLADCTKFVKANAPFAITGRAVCSDASTSVAQSYRSTVGLTHQLVAPTSGVVGLLDISQLVFDGTGIAAGEANEANQKISEVGVFTLTTAPPSYFSQTIAPWISPNIGRFYPDEFKITIINSTFQPSCTASNSFTYMDEPFLFLTAPNVTIEAINVDGDKTGNYEGDFWKLGTDLAEDSSCNGAGTIKGFCYTDNVLGGADLSAPSASISYGLINDAGGEVVITLHDDLTDEFKYARPVTGLVDPFDADIKLNIDLEDSDGATGTKELSNIGFSGDTDPIGGDQSITNDEFLRYGRWILENAFGPETDALKIPMSAQYYDGATFVTNIDDSCSVYDAANMDVLPNLKSSGTTTPVGSGTVSSGLVSLADQIELSAPGVGHDGTAALCLSVENWLKFDWNGDDLDLTLSCDLSGAGDQNDNPLSTATFGRYRGHDRIIYWREVSN